MSEDPNAFTVLRRAIRQSGTQYRNKDGKLGGLFDSEHGFCYAYEIGKVEDALDAYEVTMPTKYHEQRLQLPLKENILRMSEAISNTHPDMGVRDFARSVQAWFTINDANDGKTRITHLKSVVGVMPDIDLLD